MVHGGLVIRHFRRLKGISQTMLSVNYGIAVNTLGNWERKIAEPSFMTTMDVCIFLGFSIEEIYRFVNNKNSQNDKRSKTRAA